MQGNTLPGFGDTRQSHRQIFTLNEVHTFGARLVNEARFGFNRIFITFTPNLLANPADFGINNGINEPFGLPQISITGLTFNIGGPAGFPQGRGDTTFVASDTASYLMRQSLAEVRRRVPPIPQQQFQSQHRLVQLPIACCLPVGECQCVHRHDW